MPADERRAQLLEAARRVFLKTGFAGARIRTISQEAGVNEALLYRHFESKEAIFDAAVSEPVDASVERLLLLARNSEAFTEDRELREEHLRALLTEVLDGMVASAPLLGMVLMSDPERGQVYYEERFAPAMARLVKAIEDVQDVWAHRQFDPALILHWIVGACLMLAIDERFGGSLLDDRDEVVRQFTGFVRAALGPLPD